MGAGDSSRGVAAACKRLRCKPPRIEQRKTTRFRLAAAATPFSAAEIDEPQSASATPLPGPFLPSLIDGLLCGVALLPISLAACPRTRLMLVLHPTAFLAL